MTSSTDNLPANSPNINTLFKFSSPSNADSVEWCPHDPHKNLFVCANYRLLDKSTENLHEPQTRVGKILLFTLQPDLGLVLEQTIDTAAVLDQKWCPFQIDGSSILGVVNADATLQIYRFDSVNHRLKLVTLHRRDVAENDEVLLLSLDWTHSQNEPAVICSDSKGGWCRFKFLRDQLELESEGNCHEFEAWIAAFYYWDSNVFFTGGDDSQFLKFDRRTGNEPVARNKRHEAGVTCIHSNVAKEFIVASGSYDEKVRIWDVRNMRNPINEKKMPGPLWRLKWDPFNFTHLLAACMLGGAHILELKNENKLEIVANFFDHKSITYGADWSHLNNEHVSKYEFKGNRIIGTCSFYDNLLCLAKVDLC